MMREIVLSAAVLVTSTSLRRSQFSVRVDSASENHRSWFRDHWDRLPSHRRFVIVRNASDDLAIRRAGIAGPREHKVTDL
jgi:hypothetical protein